MAEFGSGFTVMPELVVEKVGYGVGTRTLEARPNVLRAVLGNMDKKWRSEVVVQIETNIDDLSPEVSGTLVERLLTMGALEAFLTPVQMKKNRPGVLLTVLCAPLLRMQVEDFLFRELSLQVHGDQQFGEFAPPGLIVIQPELTSELLA